MTNYKKCLLILLLAIFNASVICAQNQTKLDSLKAVLETNISEKNKVDILVMITDIYSYSDSAKTALYGNKAIELAEAINYPKGKVDAMFNLAWMFIYDNKYAKAKDLFLEALNHATDIKYLKGQSDILNGLGAIHERDDAQKALSYYKKSLAISQELNDQKGLSRAFNNIGAIHRAQGDYEQAIDYYFKSLEIDKQLGDDLGVALSYTNIATLYTEMGVYYEKAIQLHREALEIYKKLNDQKRVATTFLSIGSIRGREGDNVKQLQLYIQALEIYKELKNQNGVAESLDKIGKVYMNQNEYESSIKYRQNSLEVYKKLGMKRKQAFILSHIASALFALNKYEEALQYNSLAIDIANELGFKYGLASFYRNAGNMYVELDSIDLANSYYEKSFAFAKEVKAKNFMGRSLAQIGTLENRKGNWEKARNYLRKALNWIKETKDVAYLIELLYELSTIEANLGNYQVAYELQVQYNDITDSLSTYEKGRDITRLQADFEFQQERDSVNQAQQQERLLYESELKLSERNQQFSLVGLFGALIIAVVSFRFYQTKKKANQQLSSLNAEISDQKEEIVQQAEELKTSNEKLVALDTFKEDMTGMLVHDLKNPLNTIVHSVKEYNPENNQKIGQASQQLHNMVLNILDVYKYENSQMLVEQSEVALYEIANQAIEDSSLLVHNKSILITNDISSGITVKADREIMVRVFANLLTNAIKYTPQNGKIRISAELDQNEMVSIRITDSGKGIEPENLDKIFDRFAQLEAKKSGSMRSTGLGLTFCKMAVEAHKGEIKVESEVGKGTTFIFTLPLSSIAQKENVQPAPEQVITESGISLSPAEKEALLPIVAELSQTLVFEVGKVKATLKKIQNPTEGIIKWENELNKSILSLNENAYKHLIDSARYEQPQ